ncbi:MAG: class II aldolase and adducin N-terminal domain-containing protein [Geminicoccaceae bacterium]
MATIVDIDMTDLAEQRADLAAAFRWTARLDMHEGVANHYSLAVSDDGKRFLMNPDARHFSRIKASELLLLDVDDPETMNRPDAPDPTAWCIHGRLHAALPQARCVLHAHPKCATVLACLEDSRILPIDQTTARFFERMAIDDGYTGMALADEEGDRLAAALGDKSVLMMGNHGVMVVGQSVAEAFDTLFYLERAAQTMVLAYQTGQPLRVLPDDIARRTAQQWAQYPEIGEKHLSELKRLLDEDEPDYRG